MARWLKSLTIAGVAALGVWGAVEWRAASAREAAARAAAARQARVEAVGYYRVRAAYIVKDTGERIAFDYVAACATVVTMYRDGDSSVDTPFGIAPKMMFAATRDGHAIQLVTPRACHHEVEKGWIPPDLIPLTIWHDDVDNLAFGWGYKSQDAYDNPRSRLAFEGATVTAATYADFLAWRAKAEATFKPVGKIRSPWGYSGENGSGLKVSTACHFYIRYPVLAAGKPALTAEWERRGRPEFWLIDDRGSDPEAWNDLPQRGADNFYPGYVRPRTKGGGLGSIDLYSDQRWCKSRYDQDRIYPNNEVYPYLPISLSSTPPPTLASSVFPIRVPVSDDWKGMAACGVNDPSIDRVFRGRRFNWTQRHGDEGELIGDRTAPFIVNELMLTATGYDTPIRFFQRDEFVLTRGPTNLESVAP